MDGLRGNILIIIDHFTVLEWKSELLSTAVGK